MIKHKKINTTTAIYWLLSISASKNWLQMLQILKFMYEVWNRNYICQKERNDQKLCYLPDYLTRVWLGHMLWISLLPQHRCFSSSGRQRSSPPTTKQQYKIWGFAVFSSCFCFAFLHLFFQPVHGSILTVSMKLLASHLWTQQQKAMKQTSELGWLLLSNKKTFTFLLCNVVQAGERACAAEQPRACWEVLIFYNLIHRLELPLSRKKKQIKYYLDSYIGWISMQNKNIYFKSMSAANITKITVRKVWPHLVSFSGL